MRHMPQIIVFLIFVVILLFVAAKSYNKPNRVRVREHNQRRK